VDFGLVSEKNLSQKYGSLGWLSRPDKFAENTKTCRYCDVTFRKPKTKKIFLTCSLRLAECVEGLKSSLVQSAGESWRCKLYKNCKKMAHAGLKGWSTATDLMLHFTQHKSIRGLPLAAVSLSRCIICQDVCVQQPHARLPYSDFK